MSDPTDMPEQDDTGPHPVDHDYLRLELARARTLQLEREAGQRVWKWAGALAGAAVTIVASTFIVLHTLRAEAQQVVDAGVTAVDAKVAALDKRQERFEGEADNRFKRVEKSQGRMEDKMDKLLDALRIPNPAPKPPDGGSP